jgi:hypothetical protein
MEKLVVLSNDNVRLLTDAKKFNYKWMEEIDGQWTEITDIHFEVTHLSELQIADLMVTLEDAVTEPDASWTEKIDWSDPEIVSQMKKDQHVLDKCMDFQGLIDGKYDYEESKTFTVPVDGKSLEEAKNDVANLIKQYQESLEFDDTTGLLNYEVVYDYKAREDQYKFYVERRESNMLTQEMIHLISQNITTPVIKCEDSELEDSIVNHLRRFDLNTKKLVQKLLNEGTIAYERIFNTEYSEVIGLSEIQSDLLRKDSNLWKYGYGVFQRNLLQDQISLIQFYPNDEFESYREMMDCLYEAYDLEKEPYKLNCGIWNSYQDFLDVTPTFRQKAFIKKSFIEDRYFNVSNDETIDNEESFDTFLRLLEKTVAEFYEDLIRANSRFRNEYFSIEV